MRYHKHRLSGNDKFDVIEFVSVGNKGSIEKLIHIDPTDNPNIFNLSFGDKKLEIYLNEVFFGIDDKIKSANGDMDSVLATVISAAYEYTSKYPERWLSFDGSDEIRTRLYRMVISLNYAELSNDFDIFGTVIVNNEPVPVPFDCNTRYDGFLVKRKL